MSSPDACPIHERLKPAARARTHMMAAALTWTAVAAGLGAAGARWALGASTGGAALALAAGLVLGGLKGHFVIRRVARRLRDRILDRGDGKCVGGFFPWRSWLLVGGMMGLGLVLRLSPIPRPVLGAVYVGLGAALAMGSVVYWRGVAGRGADG
ncbi:MAG: hypothetical protein ACQEXJ_00890 [Myxococcota bacterium]